MIKNNRINPDIHRLHSLCKRYVRPPGDIIEKTTKSITIIPEDLSKSSIIYKKIIKDIEKNYPQSEIAETDDGSLRKIRIIRNGYGIINVIFPKRSQSLVLRPGIAYELYFHSVIVDGLSYVSDLKKELNEIPSYIFDKKINLTLLITSNNKTHPIDRINSVHHVGGKNEKSDIKIIKKDNKEINISLKQSNFFSWGSANTFNPKYSKIQKEFLEKAIEKGVLRLDGNKVIFPDNVDGIRTSASLDEIKNYAFGYANNKVDYIVINAKQVNFNQNKRIIYMNAETVYKNGNMSDLRKLQNDAYLIIRKSSGNASALRPYQDVGVGYYNKSHAYNSRDYNYIDV